MAELTAERLAEIERDAVNDPYGIHPDVVLMLLAEIRRLRNERETGFAEAVFGTITEAEADNTGSGG